MAAEQFISQYTAAEIEEMLDKVKKDMTIIQYTQNEINSLLQKIDEFTMPDIPSKTSEIVNDSGFITNTVDNLTNYYTKNNLYNKDEIDDLILNHTIRLIRVDELPTENIYTKGIYLVLKQENKRTDSNIYEEYINVDGTENGWEKIGETKLDLSNYITLEALETKLNDYITSTSLSSILNLYVTTTALDNRLESYLTQSDLSNYYTKREIDRMFNPPILYTIKFNGNTATGSKADIVDVEDDNITSIGDATGFNIPSYKQFKGWALNSTETNNANIFSNSTTIAEVITQYLISNDGTEIILYAIWEDILYTIEFDGNSATGSKSSISNILYNDNIVIGDSTGFTTPENKEFAGWALSSTETETSNILPDTTTATSIITSLSDNRTIITLFAIWNDIPTTPSEEGTGENTENGTGEENTGE